MSFQKVINAWQQAAEDLKIKIQSPFILTTVDKETIKFDLLIENFGNKLGTIILSTNDLTEFETVIKYGYYCSYLNPDNYSIYEKRHFVDTLNDWGYFGDGSKMPNWYTGLSWT